MPPALSPSLTPAGRSENRQTRDETPTPRPVLDELDVGEVDSDGDQGPRDIVQLAVEDVEYAALDNPVRAQDQEEDYLAEAQLQVEYIGDAAVPPQQRGPEDGQAEAPTAGEGADHLAGLINSGLSSSAPRRSGRARALPAAAESASLGKRKRDAGDVGLARPAPATAGKPKRPSAISKPRKKQASTAGGDNQSVKSPRQSPNEMPFGIRERRATALMRADSPANADQRDKVAGKGPLVEDSTRAGGDEAGEASHPAQKRSQKSRSSRSAKARKPPAKEVKPPQGRTTPQNPPDHGKMRTRGNHNGPVYQPGNWATRPEDAAVDHAKQTGPASGTSPQAKKKAVKSKGAMASAVTSTKLKSQAPATKPNDYSRSLRDDDENQEGGQESEQESNAPEQERHQGRSKPAARPQATAVARNGTQHRRLSNRQSSLFGQRERLRQVADLLSRVGIEKKKDEEVRHDLQLKAKGVVRVVNLAESACKKYRRLAKVATAEQFTQGRLNREITGLIENIEASAQGLLESEGGAKKQEDAGLQEIRDVYAFGLPKLIVTFEAALECYDSELGMDDRALDELVRILDVIDALGAKAGEAEVRPPGSLNIIKPNRAALSRLRHVRDAFGRETKKRHVDREEQERAREVERSHKTAEDESARQREDHQRKVGNRRRLIKEQLARRSQLTELSMAPFSGSGSLRSPSAVQDGSVHSVEVDDDYDRRSVERVEMFGHVGVEGDGEDEWRPLELRALIEGLERFTGRDRYTQIFNHYTKPGQELQARDFDEMWAKAREIRTDFMADVELHPDGREVPAWLLSV
ncbi:MAG: hypothetical protein M1832_006232 [Thelocarpon impressellum]|nr:MAG: hypothetical protein M1832_006232 [Thelocarpon impressellum]